MSQPCCRVAHLLPAIADQQKNERKRVHVRVAGQVGNEASEVVGFAGLPVAACPKERGDSIPPLSLGSGVATRQSPGSHPHPSGQQPTQPRPWLAAPRTSRHYHLRIGPAERWRPLKPRTWRCLDFTTTQGVDLGRVIESLLKSQG